MLRRPRQAKGREFKSSGDSSMDLGTVVNIWEMEQFGGVSVVF